MVPRRLEAQVKYLESNELVVVVGSYVQLFTESQKNFAKLKFPLTDEKIKKQWMVLSPFADPSVMFRKSVYNKTSGYSKHFWPADDVHMWYQLGRLGKLVNMPRVLTKVRWHQGAGSIRSHRKQMKKTWEVHQWAKDHVENPGLQVQLFWVGQYVAGVILPAEFNWSVYRVMKRIIHGLGLAKGFVRRTLAKNKILNKVIVHPKKASFSGT